jgi:addiction module RelB/DinJ family antitoxin
LKANNHNEVQTMSIQVSTRIDEATKKQFDKICESIGISPSNALSMFIKGVINHNGIPFSAVAPVRPNDTPGILPVEYESVSGPPHLMALSGNKPKMSREDVFGCMRGQFIMADDFNAPLDDFKEYTE